MTNYEKIKVMDEIELAGFIDNISAVTANGNFCPAIKCIDYNPSCNATMCKGNILLWLQSEVEQAASQPI